MVGSTAARTGPRAPWRAAGLLWLVGAALLLGGCASGPRRTPGVDGPGANPPAALEQVPDAVPRIEPLRSGGPNKPYEVLGQRYVPLSGDVALQESGLASWYGRKFHGLPTSTGEPYDMYAMTAAHKTMPLPSYARVRNPANGREIIVRVNDRGPFAAGRVIDLSYTAALKLGVLRGVAPVQVTRITFDEIRSGAWRGALGEPMAAAAAAPATVVAATPTSAPAAVPAAVAAAAGPSLVGDDPAPGQAPAAGFWLQLGAFKDREGAQEFQQRLLREADGGYSAVGVFDESGWFRVQAGPYATRALALQAAEQQRRNGRNALVVERGRP